MLVALPPSFYRKVGAALSNALAFRAVFVAQPTCARLGGAAVDRAGFVAMFSAEPSALGFVGATTHRAQLLLPPSSPLLFLIPQQL